MQKSFFAGLCAVMLLLAVAAPAGVVHGARPAATAQVVLSGLTFQPDEITVTLGDTVEWENQGGFHTVTGDDGSFSSGDASSEPFKFKHTFTQVGAFKYHCEVHETLGMVGTVIVESAGDVYLPQLAKLEGNQR